MSKLYSIAGVKAWHLMGKANRNGNFLASGAGLAALTVAAFFFVAVNIRASAQLMQPAGGPAPSFEVASIRPSRADVGGTNYQISNARFQADNATLTDLIRLAYDIKSNDQLPNDPRWITSQKFDIDAKVDDSDVEAMGKLPPDRKIEQYRLMVRSLLEDRFKLKVRTRMKVLLVYALVVAKGGPKLTPVQIPPEAMTKRLPTISGGSRGALKAVDVSMALFSDWISGSPETENRVVIDATGLKGSYNFTLNWTPENLRTEQLSGANRAQGPMNPAAPDSAELSIFTSLQEQLGLKLEPRKAPVEVLVIDHVEEPSPN